MAERIPAKTNTQKLREVTDSLPEFTQQYFYSGTSGKAILTRLSYALDIRYFLEYAVNFFPYFPDKQVKELSLEDIKQIKATDIDNFLTWMDEDQKLSERTRARRRSSVSGLFEYLIKNSSKADDLVLDLFGGSGTTMIACQKTKRIARLMELDPHYCDVIRRRWTTWCKENGVEPGEGALE